MRKDKKSPTRNACTLGFDSHIGNAIFPFPQVFSPSPFPLAREPTVTAWRGTTLSNRIDRCRSLIMPPRFVRRLRNNTAQSLVLHTQGLPHVKNKRTCVRVRKMKAQFLARGKKEHKNQKANDYNKLQSLQNGLVCDVSSAFDLLAAVAARVPSSKSHNPRISVP